MRLRRRFTDRADHLDLLRRENERLRSEIASWETFAAGAYRREREALEAAKLSLALNVPYPLPHEELTCP